VRASVPPPEARSLHRSDTLDDSDLLPPPEEVAAEIVENLETALERFRWVAAALGRG
jgi:type I restriction enzyme M protein